VNSRSEGSLLTVTAVFVIKGAATVSGTTSRASLPSVLRLWHRDFVLLLVGRSTAVLALGLFGAGVLRVEFGRSGLHTLIWLGLLTTGGGFRAAGSILRRHDVDPSKTKKRD